MKTDKILFLILPALLLFLPMLAAGQETDQAWTVKTFDSDRIEQVDVSTSGGFIRIYGADQEQARVEMYVRRNNRYLSQGDISLDDYEIEIEQVGNTLRAHANRESRQWRLWGDRINISVSFIVYTPRAVSVDARTSGGSMAASNITGEVQLRTSGGSISVAQLNGVLEAHTSGGSIEISSSRGEIHGRTSGGTVRLSDVEGMIDVRTSGGSIRLQDIAGQISARTSGGSINAQILDVSESVDLRTSGGSITVSIPGGTGYDLELRGNRVRTELVNFTGEAERDRIRGSVFGGGPAIHARTSGGSVRLQFQ
ncbi:MAG: DUF4097 family beta strand repeat-containing protein [Balneolaceae bacterium]